METTVNETISKETTDAKTRELNAKAKLQATKPTVTKNINTGKAITVPPTKAPKPEKKQPFAHYEDEVLLKGGSWEELIATISTEATKRGYKIPISKSYLKAHINYRLVRDKQYLGDLTLTETGIVKATKKGKK